MVESIAHVEWIRKNHSLSRKLSMFTFCGNLEPTIEQLTADLPSFPFAATSTMTTVPAQLAPLSTSAYLAKATTPESPVQTGGHHPTSHLISLLWPLVLKHEQFLSVTTMTHNIYCVVLLYTSKYTSLTIRNIFSPRLIKTNICHTLN